jgi:hypothetical protein
MGKHQKGGSLVGRPRRLSDQEKKLIKYWATDLYKDVAREPLADKIIDELKRLSLKVPTFDTLVSYISEYRNAPDPEDKPWHSGLLKDNPLSPEIVSKIMAIKHLSKLSSLVTVRQVHWIVELSQTIQDIGLLSEFSWYYAMYEKLCYPNPPDTSSLDAALPDMEQFRQTFSRLVLGFDFSEYQRVFQQTSGVELAGMSVCLDGICFIDGNAFGVKQWLVNGEWRKVIVKNMGPQNWVIATYISEKIIAKRRSYPKYIPLKKPSFVILTPAESTEMQHKLIEFGVNPSSP